MTLAAGSKLGPYEILGAIGAGGCPSLSPHRGERVRVRGALP
jgi:hypothetical protein